MTIGCIRATMAIEKASMMSYGMLSINVQHGRYDSTHMSDQVDPSLDVRGTRQGDSYVLFHMCGADNAKSNVECEYADV